MDNLKDYWQKKQIDPLLQCITTGLAYNRPESPLSYIQDCIEKIRKDELVPYKSSTVSSKKQLNWDVFLQEPIKGHRIEPLPPTVRKNGGNNAIDNKYKLEKTSGKQSESLTIQGSGVSFANPSKRPLNTMSPLPDISSSTESAPHSTFDLGDRVLVFVLGGPGSGKGTQCVRIAQEFNLTHLSVGDLLRAEVATGSELAKELDGYMKEGKIVPMDITLKLLKNAIVSSSVSSGFLIDGFPRQMDQALKFEKEMVPPHLVLYFDCPLETLEARLLKRGETSGRSDDNLDAIRKRFKTFMEQSLPVVEYYEKTGKVAKISSIPAVEEVYQTVCSTLKQKFKI